MKEDIKDKIKIWTGQIATAIIGIMIIIILSNNASAVVSDYNVQQNKPFTLSVPIYKQNNSLCSSCGCNISVTKPTGGFLVQNQSMSFSNGYCSISFSVDSLSEIGIYTAFIESVGENEYGNTIIRLDVSGKGNSLENRWITLGLIAIIMLFTIFAVRRSSKIFSDVIFIALGIAISLIDVENAYLGFILTASGIGLIISDLLSKTN